METTPFERRKWQTASRDHRPTPFGRKYSQHRRDSGMHTKLLQRRRASAGEVQNCTATIDAGRLRRLMIVEFCRGEVRRATRVLFAALVALAVLVVAPAAWSDRASTG